MRGDLGRSKGMEKGQGIMYLIGLSCILMYLDQYQLFFSFPVVLHKPVLLHQKCPDEHYASRFYCACNSEILLS